MALYERNVTSDEVSRKPGPNQRTVKKHLECYEVECGSATVARALVSTPFKTTHPDSLEGAPGTTIPNEKKPPTSGNGENHSGKGFANQKKGGIGAARFWRQSLRVPPRHEGMDLICSAVMTGTCARSRRVRRSGGVGGDISRSGLPFCTPGAPLGR